MTAAPRAAVGLRVREVIAAYGHGWTFTPLRGKRPYLAEWNSAPRPSLEQCVDWATQGNVGIRTGAASGVIVFDDDTVDGSAARAFELPRTVTAVTGSGKHHYYLRAPSFRVKNSVKELAKDVDIRGDGGQAVFPGSIHPDTGGVYRWEAGLSPSEVEVASIPPRLLARLEQQTKPRTPASREHDAAPGRAKKLIDASIRDVATAPEGQRNDTLNRAAYTLGGLVASGAADQAEVEALLEAAATTGGLESREIRGTIRSGLAAGMEVPLDLVESKLSARSQRDTSDSSAGSLGTKRPEVMIGPDRHVVLDQTEHILGDGDRPAVLNRGGVLVQTIRIPVESRSNGVTRPAGLVIVNTIDAPGLCDSMNRRVSFKRLRSRGGGWVEELVPAPISLARELISRRQWTSIPPLHGLLAGPAVLADGAILATDGYHRSAGLFLDLDGLRLPSIPEAPTNKDAREALTQLKEFLGSVPFVSDEDKAVAIAAFLTPIARPSFPHSPLFGLSAPSAGTGKSLLCDTSTIIATGRVAAAMTQAKDEEENDKLFFSLLIESSQVLLIDNCTRPISSPALCSILSQEYKRGRILGSTATAAAPTTHATWFASGNNLVIEGDMRRRALVCQLDAKEERPWEREFPRDLRDIARERRVELLVAILTILRWRLRTAKDQRPAKLKPLGGFEGWSRVVREALVLLGEPDPVAVLVRNEATDPETNDLAEFHQAWKRVVGVGQVTTADLVDLAETSADLKRAITAVGCMDRGGAINAKKLGRYVSGMVNRRLGGRWLERAGERGNAAVWRLAETRLTSTDAAGASSLKSSVEFAEFQESVPAPTREETEGSHVLGGVQQTHETPETQPPGETEAEFDQPCSGCGATAWWAQTSDGAWACNTCGMVRGVRAATAEREGAA